VSTAGLLLSLVVLARTAQCLARSWRTARAERIRQRTQLSLIAHTDEDLDVDVLDHPSCAAYGVPGRAGRIVITWAAQDALDPGQMTAVVTHERAHFRGRHHLVIQCAASLHAASPFVPAFRHAEDEVARLTEMVADDAATRTVDRLTLATALVRLAEGSTPAGALGAGGSTALLRVRRLADPAVPLSPMRRLGTRAGVALIVMTPLVVAAALAVSWSQRAIAPSPWPLGLFPFLRAWIEAVKATTRALRLGSARAVLGSSRPISSRACPQVPGRASGTHSNRTVPSHRRVMIATSSSSNRAATCLR